MFKVIATDVVISKGYDGAPALKFSENGEMPGNFTGFEPFGGVNSFFDE